MPKKVIVQQGDTLTRLAASAGFAPDTIWSHPDNQPLAAVRANPNILFPGDTLTIPDIDPKTVEVETGSRHLFVRKGGAMLSLRVQRDRIPVADASYLLYVDNTLVSSGKTDEDGLVLEPVTACAGTAKLVIGKEKLELCLGIGHLDPISTAIGVQKRLANLGFYVAPQDGKDRLAYFSAIATFQASADLEVTGAINDETREALVALHDRHEAGSNDPQGALA